MVAVLSVLRPTRQFQQFSRIRSNKFSTAAGVSRPEGDSSMECCPTKLVHRGENSRGRPDWEVAIQLAAMAKSFYRFLILLNALPFLLDFAFLPSSFSQKLFELGFS